jgi:hypothetical protein
MSEVPLYLAGDVVWMREQLHSFELHGA